MGVILALVAALGYGLSDFIGGVISRRTSAWPVAFLAAVGSCLAGLTAALSTADSATGAQLWWGALAGVGSGLGGAFLYRGFVAGRIGVVAPISAVGAALLPVAVGVLTGEHPALLVWLGVIAAVPGIWLVSAEPANASGPGAGIGEGVVDGVAAGLGFGLMFAALAQVPDGAGYWPVALAQIVSVPVIVVAATLLRTNWLPRHPGQAWGLLAGAVAGIALVSFQLAAQRGLLTVSAVLASLYPAVTILLAVLFLKERVLSSQAVGLALCGVTVVCTALA